MYHIQGREGEWARRVPALDAKKTHFWINVKGQAVRKLGSLSLSEKAGEVIQRKERDLESCSGNSPVRAQHFSFHLIQGGKETRLEIHYATDQ